VEGTITDRAELAACGSHTSPLGKTALG